VIIDEAQDYNPMQYEVFKQLFRKASKTLLGDIHQNISLYGGVKDYAILMKLFSDEAGSAAIKLKKSYRSTKEIFDFCNRLLPAGEDVMHIGRHGEIPRLIKAEDHEAMASMIIDDIKGQLKEGLKSIAIICKNVSEAEEVYSRLSDNLDISLITKETEVFSRGIVVVPSYLSKGLEFDSVIAYDISDSNYSDKSHLGLLYVTLTRALHKLHVYYVGDLSGYLNEK